MYPEYMPLEDEILPAEEQPLPAAASPTTDSPGYVPESDPEEEPEADNDEESEEDPDDADDEDEDEDRDEEEEEEHPVPTNSVLPVHRMTGRISIRDEPSISLPPKEKLLSSDRRADRPEITLPPQKRLGIDLGPRCEVGESSAAAATRPIGGRRVEYRFVDTMDAKISQQRAEEVGYRIRDAWVDPRDAAEEVVLTTLEGVNTRVTELAAVHEQDTQNIYGVIEDTQGRQTQIYHRIETLVDDSQYHYETAQLLDQEALAADSRIQIMTSEMLQADHMRQAEIAALRTFDHTRQEQLVQTLTLMHLQRPIGLDQGVTATLAARDANRAGDDNDTSGTGVRRTERVARECTYLDFMKCQPLYFKGTEGVVELTQWFERMETVFRISHCLMKNQIKFSTCTLLASALTWWNSHVRIVGHDVAYAMTVDRSEKEND
ncbi:hypothetical protein Tco_0992381 [Tanacetum coccineum]|uniref:Reverse transcriptase domain-containing protein n=1 Tax=Tanacetum coccineum TaxID=301880 RepID=A0ABQ5F3M0_9ASTR